MLPSLFGACGMAFSSFLRDCPLGAGLVPYPIRFLGCMFFLQWHLAGFFSGRITFMMLRTTYSPWLLFRRRLWFLHTFQTLLWPLSLGLVCACSLIVFSLRRLFIARTRWAQSNILFTFCCLFYRFPCCSLVREILSSISIFKKWKKYLTTSCSFLFWLFPSSWLSCQPRTY